MTKAFDKTFPEFFAQTTLEALGLDTCGFTGLEEVLTSCASRFLLPIAKKHPPEKTQEEFYNLRDYLGFQIGLIHDFHSGFYETHLDIPEEIYCALLGGGDMLGLNWKTPAAREAKKLIARTHQVIPYDLDGFSLAETEIQFYYMLDTLDNLLVGYNCMIAKRESIDLPMLQSYRFISDCAMRAAFPKTPLADEIARTVPRVLQEINVTLAQLQPRPQRRGPRPFA